MWSVSLTGKYDSNNLFAGSKNIVSGTAGVLAVTADDLKLRAKVSDDTILTGDHNTNLSFALEKPGTFLVDYDVGAKDVKFQFTNKMKILDRDLQVTYNHGKKANRTSLGGVFELNPTNKISGSYALDSRACKLKYSYSRGGGTTIEPSYDFANDSYQFAVSQRICEDDVLSASYETKSKVLACHWSRNWKNKGVYKISTTLNMSEGVKIPRLSAESTWNFNI